MAQNNATVEVEHNGETISVPTHFERSDLATWFGSVPKSFDVDRVFVLDENIRVETQLDGEWIEVIYQTEDSAPVFNASELGWVAQVVQGGEADPDYPNAEDADHYPGETVWIR